MSEPQSLPYRDEFEKHGEAGTRYKFAGKPGDVGRAADVWLLEQEALRSEAAALKRDAREEETLSIAREALSNSKSASTNARLANRIAITAMVLSAAIAISAIIIGVMFGSK